MSAELNLSPQSIHRHLRILAANSLIESQGQGPQVRYHITGKPRLSRMMDWATSTRSPEINPPEEICQTRDLFTARLGRMPSLLKEGLNEDELSLLISTTSEIGNNSFDHNLGLWKDLPGCWFETRITGSRFWVMIADRGQGIFSSLTRAGLDLPDEETALKIAFEKTVTGRFPEQRGNGLKFVRRIIEQSLQRGLACRSGRASTAYGPLSAECLSELERFPKPAIGTITILLWSFP